MNSNLLRLVFQGGIEALEPCEQSLIGRLVHLLLHSTFAPKKIHAILKWALALEKAVLIFCVVFYLIVIVLDHHVFQAI